MILKPCPFCGQNSIKRNAKGQKYLLPVTLEKISERVFKTDVVYYRVKCLRCGAEGGPGAVGHNALTDTTTTDERAKNIAIDKWNQRF